MELEFINKKDEDHKEKGVEGKQRLKDQTRGRDLTRSQTKPLPFTPFSKWRLI